MTEPVTAHTRRFVRCVWSLDRDLAYARHYPAVSWRDSSSRDVEARRRLARRARRPALGGAPRAGAAAAGRGRPPRGDGRARRRRLAARPRAADAAAPARLLREAVLQQSALQRERRATARRAKQAALLELVLGVHDRVPRAARSRRAARRRSRQVDLSPVDARARRRRRPDGADEVDAIARAAARALAGARVTLRAPVEYTARRAMRGPLLVVEGVAGVGWDEVAEIRLASGEARHGVVLEVERRPGGGAGLRGHRRAARRRRPRRFAGAPMRIPVGEGWLGRVCNGRGEPLDGGPPVFGGDAARRRRPPDQPGRARDARATRSSPASR